MRQDVKQSEEVSGSGVGATEPICVVVCVCMCVCVCVCVCVCTFTGVIKPRRHEGKCRAMYTGQTTCAKPDKCGAYLPVSRSSREGGSTRRGLQRSGLWVPRNRMIVILKPGTLDSCQKVVCEAHAGWRLCWDVLSCCCNEVQIHGGGVVRRSKLDSAKSEYKLETKKWLLLCRC